MELKLKDISFTYNSNTKLKREVLQGVNLICKDSKVYTVMGSSSKTTLLEIINGSLTGKGTLEFTGRKKMKVGMIFKNPERQFLKKTIKKELELTVNLLEPKKRLEKLENILKQVGLTTDYLKRSITTLSQSEMKKVALASLLLYNPNIVLLDEPTIGLDSKSIDDLIKIIRFLKTRNKIVIIATKDSGFAFRISDNITILDNGRIVLEGDKFEIFKSPKLKKYNVSYPKIVEFSNMANEKGINLEYREDTKDLMKDVYHHASK